MTKEEFLKDLKKEFKRMWDANPSKRDDILIKLEGTPPTDVQEELLLRGVTIEEARAAIREVIK